MELWSRVLYIYSEINGTQQVYSYNTDDFTIINDLDFDDYRDNSQYVGTSEDYIVLFDDTTEIIRVFDARDINTPLLATISTANVFNVGYIAQQPRHNKRGFHVSVDSTSIVVTVSFDNEDADWPVGVSYTFIKETDRNEWTYFSRQPQPPAITKAITIMPNSFTTSSSVTTVISGGYMVADMNTCSSRSDKNEKITTLYRKTDVGWGFLSESLEQVDNIDCPSESERIIGTPIDDKGMITVPYGTRYFKTVMVDNLDSLPEIPTSPPSQIPETNIDGDSDGMDLNIILIIIVVLLVLFIVGLQIKGELPIKFLG